MKVAVLTTDSREHYKDYQAAVPYFGMAPEALLQGLARMPDLKVHVISCVRARMHSPAKLANNIFFHALVVPKTGWISTGYQGCIRAIRSKLQEIDVDLVHGQGTERECAMGSIFSGRPNVVTIHGNMAEMARVLRSRIGSFGWLAARFENFALRRTCGVLCNSEYTERLVAPRAQRTWRVPNAIRSAFFAPPGPAGPPRCRLLNVGQISPRKRQLELLDLVRDLHGQGLEFTLEFIGGAHPENAYAAEFLEKIKPLEAAGVARFVGQKPTAELIQLFDASAGVIHFPSEEAFGLVVAEALARDLKFFGARTGGILDITAGVPAVELFELDDWSGLKTALAGWIRQGNPRAREAAGLMRARYHPDVVARLHLEIYRDVLKRAQRK